ncbi:uncharacterized protein LOC134176208 isoform X2 [Corticium candelabrum]|uniref:uncharacterized protein LOC134176208 isoform X2 n=1 Tax=Corticium candelabrum TaxID=121492 RepID=UPI002E26B66C|nr:uncharacterized protein LOC134176208 isoform X2 [Corticium candelabrum]
MTAVFKLCTLAALYLASSEASTDEMSESVYPTATQTEYIDNKKPPPPPPHPPPPPPPPHHHKDDIPSYDQKYFILESNNGTCLNVSMAIIFTIVYDMLENSTSISNFELPEDVEISGDCPSVYDYRNNIITYRANVTVSWDGGDFSLTFIFFTFFYTEVIPTTAAPTTQAPDIKNETTGTPVYTEDSVDHDQHNNEDEDDQHNNEFEPTGFRIETTQDLQGQQYMSDVIFKYYTGSDMFEDPVEPYQYKTASQSQSFFQTAAGTTYLCNAHTALSLSRDVTMNIKYAVLNPFYYIHKRYNISDNAMPPVFQCAADFETDNTLMVVTACCIAGGIAVLVLVAVIIHFATQGTDNHPTAMFKTYKSGYTSFQ